MKYYVLIKRFLANIVLHHVERNQRNKTDEQRHFHDKLE